MVLTLDVIMRSMSVEVNADDLELIDQVAEAPQMVSQP
jgi:hypothetical protein